MMAPSYRIQLRETRAAKGETDDIALFDVICEEDERMWPVAVFLSPLFRALPMQPQASAEARRDMVAGLVARAITERMAQRLGSGARYRIVGGTEWRLVFSGLTTANARHWRQK